jgi:hypothetical protein
LGALNGRDKCLIVALNGRDKCLIVAMMRLLVVPVVVGLVMVEPAVGKWTETYVPYNGNPTIQDESGPYFPDSIDRQHLNYAVPSGASASNPAPVFIFAHGNGGNADINEPEVATILSTGYALVSWESITSIKDAQDLQTCDGDLENVAKWIKANGKAKGLSPINWVISGRSRGSVCSWFKAQSGDPRVSGIYMYNALPSEDITVYLNEITKTSPPIQTVYGPKCPTPIVTEGENICVVYKDGNPSNGIDIHNPISGVKIGLKYKEVNNPNTVGFRQGLHEENIGNVFVEFPSFQQNLTLWDGENESDYWDGGSSSGDEDELSAAPNARLQLQHLFFVSAATIMFALF